MASVAVLLGFFATTATAQNYRFRVPEAELHVHVLPDASARLEYKITFQCEPGARAIDVVDIGLPHRGYRIANMSASINGQPLPNIRQSEYVDPGVEVHLGGHAIRPNQQGAFAFTCTMPDMVYQDTTRDDYASLRITPTWYGEEFVVGRTKLAIFVYLPDGVEADEVVYQLGRNFDAKAILKEGSVVVGWNFPNTRLTGKHLVGLSFPKRTMTRVVHMSRFGLFLKWFEENQTAQMISGFFLVIALAILFFRFSGGTGCTVFVILLAGLIVLFVSSPTGHLIAWPVMLGLIGLNEWHLNDRRKRHKYLPALVSVEGGGIKRGLTAPQAAVLLELPLGKVLSLVIFGLLKKGVVRQVQADPLIVETLPDFQCGRKQRRRVAADRGIVVHVYEQPFVDLFLGNREPVREMDFTGPMRQLIKATAKRMSGFDAQETREYYRRIVARAWIEAETVGEVAQREKMVDRWFDWMILDEDYTGRFDRWGDGGWYYYPSWTRGGVGYGGAAGGGSRGPDVGGQTTFGDVSASFAGWAENTADSFASTVDPTGLGLPDVKAGVLDLSGVDRVTADVFEAMTESSGSSGGGSGGGGCACACAGCACACACAGGGR